MAQGLEKAKARLAVGAVGVVRSVGATMTRVTRGAGQAAGTTRSNVALPPHATRLSAPVQHAGV